MLLNPRYWLDQKEINAWRGKEESPRTSELQVMSDNDSKED